jgi:hypothetical protein
MAKSEKKTTQQRLIESALIFAPAPIRQIASTPLGSKVLLIAISGMLATGAFTINWDEGSPKFEFHREKAQEARERITEDLQAQGIDWRQIQAAAQAQPQNPGYPQTPGVPATGYGMPATAPYAGQPMVPASNAGYAQPYAPPPTYQAPAAGFPPYQQPQPNSYPPQQNQWNQPAQNGYYYPPTAPNYQQPQYPQQGYNAAGQPAYPPGYRR